MSSSIRVHCSLRFKLWEAGVAGFAQGLQDLRDLLAKNSQASPRCKAWGLRVWILGACLGQCKPMINTLPPFKGLNIRVLIIIPIRGRGFVNLGFEMAWIKQRPLKGPPNRAPLDPRVYVSHRASRHWFRF